MKNITGSPVTHGDFLESRRFLVDEMRDLVRTCSFTVVAPRRFGKTSVIKELKRQEDNKDKDRKEFNILFLELEGEETCNAFCLKLFNELMALYKIRKKMDMLGRFLGESWNAVASRFKSVDVMEMGLEIREKTREYDFVEWKEKIMPLIMGLNTFDKQTVIVFDEFPDMLLNFKMNATDSVEFKRVTDNLTGWLRSLRQVQDAGSKYRFVFCGSINLRMTLEDIGIGKRINDLEEFPIPSMKGDEAESLLRSLAEQYGITVEPDALDFMVSKIENGSPYYGQLLFKALRDTREKSFDLNTVEAIYDGMLRGGDNDLNHFHSRLVEYLSPLQKECSGIILKHMCHGSIQQKELYDLLLADKCDNSEFQAILKRLIYEGYLNRDIGKGGAIGFVSPVLRDWWACREGLK